MPPPAKPAPSTDQPKPGRILLARLFFLVFLIFGFGVLFFLTMRPLRQVVAARSWQETPCTIDSSKVAKVDNAHGTPAYRAQIFYHYTLGNTRFTTSHYQFDDGNTASPSQADLQKIVDQYPAGRETVCYINPTDHGRSVLYRGPTREMFYGLIGLVPGVLGVYGFVSSFRLKNAPPAS